MLSGAMDILETLSQWLLLDTELYQHLEIRALAPMLKIHLLFPPEAMHVVISNTQV